MLKQQNFFDRNIPAWKQVLFLSWPTIVELLLQTAVNYVDTAMVGSIGVNATAAVSITMSTIWLINGFMNAVGIGYSVLAAHSIGEGNYEQAKVIIRQSILAIGVAGIFLTLIVTLFIAPNLPAWMHAEKEVVPLARSYLRIIGMGYLFNISLIVCSNLLRCAGDTKTPMKFNILTNIINVVGNYLLIYPSKEIQLFGKNFLLQRAYQISLKEDFSPDSFIIRRAIRLAVPTAMERMTISFGQIAATSIITGLGTMALSANLLADTGEKICYLPVYGFATAGTTLVAQSLGAEEKDLALHYGRWCNRLGIIVMLVTSTAMFLFAVPIIDLFTDDTETILLAAQMLRIEAFAEPLLAIGVVLGGVLRGAGDTRWPFVISLLGMWVVRLPLAYTLIHLFDWGLAAVWGAAIADWAVRAAISCHRFYHKKWMTQKV